MFFAVKNTTGNRTNAINTKKVVTSYFILNFILNMNNHANNQKETFSQCTEYDDYQINNLIRIEEIITAID